VYPPDYKDFILVFPVGSGVRPVYVVVSSQAGDFSHHPAPNGLTAFPDAEKVKSKTNVKGGGAERKRWKDRKGRNYEWDSMHGTVEIYDKQGKHLGEFNPDTGAQLEEAISKRRTTK
jgi:hypothetical protein